jgi:glycosyltransferase involved in cell wall biosynthesis
MINKYDNMYSDNNMYGHVVSLVKELRLNDDGVHLDFACGFSAINDGLKNHNYNFQYIGFDNDKQSIDSLKEKNIEAYQVCFNLDENDDYSFIEKILNGRSVKLITALDILEHLEKPEILLNTLNKISKKYNATLIISVPNVCHKDIAFKMLEGEFDYTNTGLLDKTHLSLFSYKRLKQCMDNSGFQQVACNDFEMEKSDQHFPEKSTFLAKGTVINQYLEWIKKSVDPFASVNQFVRAYLPLQKKVEKVQSEQTPFLSIITRTQGNRIQALTEVLLCLSGQTYTDFEILIMGHNLTLENQIAIEQLIEEMPIWIKEKISLIKVDNGTRTTPLNVGFEKARGEYISILDDDDIVFDNWVEEFYNLSQKAPGSVLHAYAVAQDWEVTDMHGTKALRAVGPPNNVYCVDFNLLKQLSLNFCPTMSYACPSYTFQKLGIRFNENLTTTEDWDFLMRTAFISGVSDSSQVTSIYRIWKNSENSQTVHSNQEWKVNEKIIKHQFNQTPIVLPKGYASKTSCNSQRDQTVANQHIDQNIMPILFVDFGQGYTENTNILSDNNDTYSWCFSGFVDKGIYNLRIDPVEYGSIWVSAISIEVTTNNDQVLTFGYKDISSNGCKFIDGFWFFTNDPQLYVKFDASTYVKNVIISYKMFNTIPNNIIQAMNVNNCLRKRSILYRGVRKLYRIIKRFI